MSTLFHLCVPRRVLEEMLAQAVAELPNECCGVLAGKVEGASARAGERPMGVVERCYPLVNEARSPVEYLSDPQSMLTAVKDMRQRGIDILAVYHSHPTSAAVPSRKDRERNYSSEVVNLIISLQGKEPQVRGWWLTEESFQEAEWECVDDSGGHWLRIAPFDAGTNGGPAGAPR